MNSITDEVVIKSSGRSVYRVSLVVVIKECRFFAGYRKDREIGSGTAHNSASFVRCRERNMILCLKERRKDLEKIQLVVVVVASVEGTWYTWRVRRFRKSSERDQT